MIKRPRWKRVNKVKKKMHVGGQDLFGVMEMFQNWIAVMVIQLHKSKKKNH